MTNKDNFQNSLSVFFNDRKNIVITVLSVALLVCLVGWMSSASEEIQVEERLAACTRLDLESRQQCEQAAEDLRSAIEFYAELTQRGQAPTLR